jgi:hypothetical protein
MAFVIHEQFGGKPKLEAAVGVTSGRYPPLKRQMLYAIQVLVAGMAVLRTVS